MLSDDFSDDDRPLASSQPPTRTNGHVTAMNGDGEDSPMSEDEMPLSQKSRTTQATPQAPSRKRKAVVDSSSDDDVPLASSPPKASSAAVPMPGAIAATTVLASTTRRNGRTNGVKSYKEVDSGDDGDSDDDAPLGIGNAMNGKAKTKPPPKKKLKREDSDDAFEAPSDDKPPQKVKGPPKMKRNAKKATVSSDDDKPLTKKATPKRVKKEDASEPDTPKAKNSAKVKEETNGSPKKSKVKKEEAGDSPKKGKPKKKKEDDAEVEEVFRWWEQDPNGDGTDKWQTLVHQGVYFPPPYEPLPSDVKMKYNGKPIDLPVEAEEVAGFYGALLESDHAKDETFNRNFFQDFKGVLSEHPPHDGTKITAFDLCDFRPMYEYFEAEKARKKGLSSAEKKELKKEKDTLEGPFTTCVLDGRKEKVGNFRVEPPGLFRGRGDHPKKGALKHRVHPEDVTINIGEGVPIPKPNMPGKWKAVTHDKTVTWLANWTENVNGNHKYVFLAAGSSIKGQSDMTKFEKARELKKHVDRIRQDYEADLKNRVMADRQRATAMYFIDKLALRAGNEKGEDEADTVGCCSLRCEHVTLEPPPPYCIVFDFLGKDSIRYYNKVTVDPQVFKNIKIFKNDKNDDDSLFDRVTTGSLNKHLQSYMKGLTAKVFRTYNASITFQEQLDQGVPDGATVQEKLNIYNKANRMVAILCNHQRAAPKTHDQSMGKLRDKIRGMKYERMKLRHALFQIDPKFKKQKNLAEPESDLDDEWIAEYEEQMKAKEIEKAEKKFTKDNEKLVEEGKEEQDESLLKERITSIEVEYKRLKKERGTGKASLKRDRPTEKIEEAISKLDEKIKTTKLQAVDREEGKEVALGTSKINYLDPRITAVWCKIHSVPIERIFSKTLLNKFPWALEVDEDWKF